MALELEPNWTEKINPGVPQQVNGYDCGAFCCQFMKFERYGSSPMPNWSSEDMKDLRKMMVLELYEERLRWRLF